nr:MAG TPA: hypothetical protein [Caudoviricetes sp.]
MSTGDVKTWYEDILIFFTKLIIAPGRAISERPILTH